MKNIYTLVCFTLISIIGFAQNYEFGLVHISNYDFKVVAIPDFTSAGDTDVSDIGFTLVLPAGGVSVINQVSSLSGRTCNLSEFNAAFLTGQGLGDGTKDVFQFNIPPGQSLFSHTTGQQIDLVSFQISNNPTTDEMYFLLNTDPIATGSGGVLDSFYNSNIDATTTQDYFSGIATGMESFPFSSLSVNEYDELKQGILIYPNPTKEYINISTSLALDKVEIYDLLGNHILNTLETTQIKVKHLPTGIYLIKVYATIGTLTKKIVIE